MLNAWHCFQTAPYGSTRVWFQIKDEAGNVTSVLGVSRDITERKLAEAEISRHREQLRSMARWLKNGSGNASRRTCTPGLSNYSPWRT